MTDLDVFAYYFPHWHRDRRNDGWFSPGFNEWALLGSAQPRFPGHRQPRVPAWGEYDGSDPAHAAREIQLARSHGLSGFIVDYYWYEDGPYLSDALDHGLLAAPNASDMKFALMWANHNLVDIFPARAENPAEQRLLAAGGISREAFDRLAEHVINTYFTRPNYLRIDGAPWFSVYDLAALVEGLGGTAEAKDALSEFERRARLAGFPGVHLDIVIWSYSSLPGTKSADHRNELIRELGFDSASSYVWIHHSDLKRNSFPAGDWEKVRADAYAEYESLANSLDVPLSPNVSVGWDSSPRVSLDRPFHAGAYPWLPVFDAEPADIEIGMDLAADFIRRHHPEYRLVTVNAWNEWTEGAILLPERDRGDENLRALARGIAANRRDVTALAGPPA